MSASAATAGEVLAAYLHAQAGDFLRALRLHRDSGQSGGCAQEAADAAHLLRRAARRTIGTLHVYRQLTDTSWADPLRSELAWLTDTLAREHAYAARLERLRAALHRLAGSTAQPDVGPARAGALLERQLTLARTRAHTAALQALGSARFHAVADAVALLASEVPLDETAARPAAQVLPRLADLARLRLAEAVGALPLARAQHPYSGDGLAQGLAPVPADGPSPGEAHDEPWHAVRRLVRMRRYALEVLEEAQRHDGAGTGPHGADPAASVRLLAAGQALERHREAADAATAAATAARTPRIAPATAYALGVLHADQRHEVEAARFTFGRVWQRMAPGPLGGEGRGDGV
ncbi:CHAD domain-containing protein [Streptomyces sp. B1866]|uniref:CHAD domain-containing protein n=1 Tax=Streptomyces sp. B1866 TaxID=3075431 RepID=UPI00288F7944|nr:CHAD domain-containing protein [Streptomyces sp. B1866]MDT3396796.1 CHAD domain-containing protein [Streptomyces sp. B1866]